MQSYIPPLDVARDSADHPSAVRLRLVSFFIEKY